MARSESSCQLQKIVSRPRVSPGASLSCACFRGPRRDFIVHDRTTDQVLGFVVAIMACSNKLSVCALVCLDVGQTKAVAFERVLASLEGKEHDFSQELLELISRQLSSSLAWNSHDACSTALPPHIAARVQEVESPWAPGARQVVGFVREEY